MVTDCCNAFLAVNEGHSLCPQKEMDVRMLSVSLGWRSLNIGCLSLAAASAVIEHKDDSTCRDDDQRLSPPGSHRNEEANRYIILDWGMYVMKHREAYMMPYLRRETD